MKAYPPDDERFVKRQTSVKDWLVFSDYTLLLELSALGWFDNRAYHLTLATVFSRDYTVLGRIQRSTLVALADLQPQSFGFGVIYWLRSNGGIWRESSVSNPFGRIG